VQVLTLLDVNNAIISVCMLIQDDEVEPVYTELKRENVDDKSKRIVLYTLGLGDNWHKMTFNIVYAWCRVQFALKCVVFACFTALP
jgi:hypothetical protein